MHIKKTLQSLDAAGNKLKHIPLVVQAVKISKGRHLAGEAYRQFSSGNPRAARKFLVDAIIQNVRIIYIIGIFLTFIPIPSSLFKRMRFFFKRIY